MPENPMIKLMPLIVYDQAIWNGAERVFDGSMPTDLPTTGTKFLGLQIYKIIPDTVAHIIYIDPARGNRQYVLMDGDYDVYFADPGVDCTAMITFVQDDTGSRLATFHYNDDANATPAEPRVKWVAGTVLTLSTAAREEDVLSLEWNRELNRYIAMYTQGCV